MQGLQHNLIFFKFDKHVCFLILFSAWLYIANELAGNLKLAQCLSVLHGLKYQYGLHCKEIYVCCIVKKQMSKTWKSHIHRLQTNPQHVQLQFMALQARWKIALIRIKRLLQKCANLYFH